MKLRLDEHIAPVLAVGIVEIVTLAVCFVFASEGGWVFLIPVPLVAEQLLGLGAKGCLIFYAAQLVGYPVVFGLGLAGNRGWRLAAAVLLVVHLVAMALCLLGIVHFRT